MREPEKPGITELKLLDTCTKEAFQVKRTLRQELERRKGRIKKRLEEARKRKDRGRPDLDRSVPQLEMARRTTATSWGGMAAVQRIAVSSGLATAIDRKVEVLKLHRPYHESDHVLNIAYNALCGGRCLDDIETRRTDEGYLTMLGVEAIPAPTTSGDFCRRFVAEDVELLQEAINEARLDVWSRQPSSFFAETAVIDADGTLVETTGECKEGMALSYKGVWGYHPLVVSLANTSEPLFIRNRSGNRPSSEGAATYFDKAVELVRDAGFSDVLLRGDTDFSQTQHLDRWDADGVGFVFGYDVRKNLKEAADGLDEEEFNRLVRKADQAVEASKRRARQPRHKEAFVKEKGYKNIRLESEDVAEFEYQPNACEKAYRMVVLRKNLSIERGEQVLFPDVRYFFYITNRRDLSQAQVVSHSNRRCNQENLIAQLSSSRALYAPVNTLVANWAYMVITSLAWTLKAWMALLLPIAPRHKDKHRSQRLAWLRSEFRTFINAVITVPAQVLTTGRRRIVRLLAWTPQLGPLFRLHAAR